MMIYPMGPNDDQRLDELMQGFASEYVEFVKAQVRKHFPLPSDAPYVKNGVTMALMTSGSVVAASLASAVWSAEQAKKLDKAGTN